MDINTIKDKIKNKTLTGGIAVTSEDETTSNEAGFYFDVITEHSVNIENNITDNYLENNTAIQDTIAHAPITVTLSGLIGELVYVPSTNNNRFLNKFYKLLNEESKNAIRDYAVTNKLSTIGQLLPPVDNITQLAKNSVVYVEDTIDRYKKIYKNFTRNMNDYGRLQEVYLKLIKLRKLNTAFVVMTPFDCFYNMYIQNISLSQANENHIANISITFKELNFTDVQVTEANQAVLARYNKEVQAQVENNGKADGVIQKDGIVYSWTKNLNLPYLKLDDFKQ